MNETYPEELRSVLLKEGICDNCVRISMKDVEGRNMYCDDEAYGIIRERLSVYPDPASGIHLIDTGNYHYMSRVFTSFIRERYDLLLIDHHTDMQEASFGGLLSCGSWAREVLEKDENLGTLTVIGPGKFEEGGEEFSVIIGGREITGCVYKGMNDSPGNLPLYISVDKDVMGTDECITNWDQGDLSVNELAEMIANLSDGRKVIGADICGGISASDPGYDERALEKNLSSDAKLIKILSGITDRK